MTKIAAAAKMLEISDSELFRRAYKECHGVIYGLRSPENVYRRWKDGLCTEPIYVTRFLNQTVATVH